MPSNAERSEVTQNQIIDAATKILREEGASRLTLAAVAKRAELSKGALTHHFPNKDSLLQAVVEHHLSLFSDSLTKAAEPYPLAYVEQGATDGSLGLAASLMGLITLYPETQQSVYRHAEMWNTHMNGVGPAIACLATDGLWLAAVLGLPQPQGQERKQILERLRALALEQTDDKAESE